MLNSLFVLLVIIVLSLPCALVLIPFAFLTGDVGPLYKTGVAIARISLAAARVRVRVEGRENIPSGQACIFMANHVSNLDPPVLFPLLPERASVFLKRSLMKIPILGYGMRLVNFVPVDRDGRVESAVESVQTAARVLESGVHILSFVEGTRSRDGRLQAFKKGPFYLAMETGAPVVPVSIYGTESMMRKGSVRIFPGTAHVTFHAPIQPRNYVTREDLMEAVRAQIALGLPEPMRS